MDKKDLVLIKDNKGNIMSGGYKINTDTHKIMDNIQVGGKNVNNILINNILPIGLLSGGEDNNYDNKNIININNHDAVLNDSIHERLLRIIGGMSEKKVYTKRKALKNNRKTKRRMPNNNT